MTVQAVSFLQGIIVASVYCGVLLDLLAIAVIDWRTRRIPNGCVLVLVALRLVLFAGDALSASFAGGSVAALQPPVNILLDSLLLSFVITVALVSMKVIVEQRTHEEGLGWGDVKLSAAGLLFLNFEQALVMLFVSVLVGLVLALFFRLRHGDSTFPFGPALCLGLAVAIVL